MAEQTISPSGGIRQSSNGSIAASSLASATGAAYDVSDITGNVTVTIDATLNYESYAAGYSIDLRATVYSLGQLSYGGNVYTEAEVIGEFSKVGDQFVTLTFTVPVDNVDMLGILVKDENKSGSNWDIPTVTIGSSGEGDEPSVPTVTATPSSPSGSTTVVGNDPVTFTWRLSKNTRSEEYAGSELQYRYVGSSAIQNLGSRNADISTFTYTEGFSPFTEVQWRVRGALSESGWGEWSEWVTFTVGQANVISVSTTLSEPIHDTVIIQGNDIRFQWNTSTSGSGVSIEGSRVLYMAPNSSDWETIEINDSSSYYTLKNTVSLTAGRYLWKVYAVYTISSKTGTFTGTESEIGTFVLSESIVVASPSSPTGSTTVEGNKEVTFSWRLNKQGEGGSYNGSELEWKYANDSNWRTLGITNYDITSFTYVQGFTPKTTVQWRVRARLDNRWGDWSESVSFQVTEEQITIYAATPNLVTPTGGNRNGAIPITFGWTIASDGEVTDSEAAYSLDDGLTWTIFRQGTGNLTEVTETVPAMTFPAGQVRWRVHAKANGDYSNWVTASFTITYDAHGSITVTEGPADKGVLGSANIRFQGVMNVVGETTETITLKEAKLCWRSGTDNDFSEIEMSVYGSRASVQVKAGTFPIGLLQWYLKSKDSTDTETETILYSAYILQSEIDSFAIKPVNDYLFSNNSIQFQWGYIAQNGQKAVKTEIRFSLDGISWNSPIDVTEAGE